MAAIITTGTLLVVALLCVSTDAAINSWQINTETAVTGADVNLAVTLEEGDTSDPLFTVTMAADASVNTYVIHSQTPAGWFKVKSGTNEIALETAKELDYEAYSSHTIVVTNDDSSDTGTATITVTITDINDNTPSFTMPSTSSTYVVVGDGKAAGTSVYTVTATDADTVDNTLTYAISTGNTNTDFSIDGTSGKITTANKLDKDTTATYDLQVTATDSGLAPRTATITLTVVVWEMDDCSSASSATISLLTLTLAGFASLLKAL